MRLTAINLPGFGSVLSFFTQPGQMFADELSGRLKVIACLERPNLIHSEQLDPVLSGDKWDTIRQLLAAGEADAQLLVWGDSADVDTALETIEERCRMALEGVPNETRKSFIDGTTVFERVLPGPDRMYPDTDTAPIAIEDEIIEERRRELPPDISEDISRLQGWRAPVDTFDYLLKRNLVRLMERIIEEYDEDPIFVASLLGHTLKHLEGTLTPSAEFNHDRLRGLFGFIAERKLDKAILREMLPVVYVHPEMDFESVLTTIRFKTVARETIIGQIPELRRMFDKLKHSNDPGAGGRWIMGELRAMALGNMPLVELHTAVEKEMAHD